MLDANHQKLADFIRQNPLLAGREGLFGGLNDSRDHELLEVFIEYAYPKRLKQNTSTFEITTEDFIGYLERKGKEKFQPVISKLRDYKLKGQIIDPPSPAKGTLRIFADILLDLGLGPLPSKTSFLYETALRKIYQEGDLNPSSKQISATKSPKATDLELAITPASPPTVPTPYSPSYSSYSTSSSLNAPTETGTEKDSQEPEQDLNLHLYNQAEPLPTEDNATTTLRQRNIPQPLTRKSKKSKKVSRMNIGGKYLRRLANRNQPQQKGVPQQSPSIIPQIPLANQAVAQQQPPGKKKKTFMNKFIKSVAVGSIVIERLLS